MARLEIVNVNGMTQYRVVLSRRNLLTLLHKLDMEGSAREIQNTDVFLDGEQAPLDEHLLILNCEDDSEHYSKRVAGPGIVHPDSETFVQKKGGVPGERLYPGRITFAYPPPSEN